MEFRRGDKIEVFQASSDEAWEPYMNDFLGCHGIVTDPDAVVNDPDALIEVSLEDRGTHRLPQDSLRKLGVTAMLIKDVLAARPSDISFIQGENTVFQAMDLMSKQGLTGVLIGSAENPLGIFTSKDLLRCRSLFPDREMGAVAVQEIMSSKLVVAEPEETVEQAMAMMIKAGIRHLPVVEDHRVVSLIGLEDLVRSHVGALTQELHYLKDYISDLQDAAHD